MGRKILRDDQWNRIEQMLSGKSGDAVLFDYIELFYNRQRRHASLNDQSPLMYEEESVY